MIQSEFFMLLLVRDEVVSFRSPRIISYSYENDGGDPWNLKIERLTCDWTTGHFSAQTELSSLDKHVFMELGKKVIAVEKFSVQIDGNPPPALECILTSEFEGQRLYIVGYIPSLHFPI